MVAEFRSFSSKQLDLAELSSLSEALKRLVAHLQRRLDQDEDESRYADLQTSLEELLEELVPLQSCAPTIRCFEAVVSACIAAGYDRQESYLEFLYTATAPRLTEFAFSKLKHRLPAADVSGTAHDLVGNLFAQMAEAVLDGDDDLTQRLPPAGHAWRWLYCAVRNDVHDYCKSGGCRLEQHIQTLEHETYERAVDRTMATSPENRQDGPALLPLEVVERRDAFLRAFEKAMQHLKPRHQQALQLRELEHQSPRDIAERMNMSEQQALDLLQYGREKRAELLLAQLRHDPAFSEVEQEHTELLSLLKRVKLLSLAQSLRGFSSPQRRGPRPKQHDGPFSDLSPPTVRGSWNGRRA